MGQRGRGGVVGRTVTQPQKNIKKKGGRGEREVWRPCGYQCVSHSEREEEREEQ